MIFLYLVPSVFSTKITLNYCENNPSPYLQKHQNENYDYDDNSAYPRSQLGQECYFPSNIDTGI